MTLIICAALAALLGFASAQMNISTVATPALSILSSATAAAVSATAAPAAPAPMNVTCGVGLSTCYVSDPTRKEAPWAGSSGAYPQCYDPSRYSCTFNFLCPTGTVKLAGLYACSGFGASNGTTFPNVTNGTALGRPRNQMFEAVVNTPHVGDVDGINGADFVVDITLTSLARDAEYLVPQMPLYQDSNSSAFGPGPNAAFPGLVVLQNTTDSMLGGAGTNLAGVFQLNGISSRGGLSQYNAVWQAGAADFGVGSSELVVYYVQGTAGMTAPYRPTSALLSNVVRVPFTISDRASNMVPTASRTCYNGDVYQPSMNTSSSDPSAAVNVQVPYPAAGDEVGVDGRGWLMDVAGTVSSSMYNSQLSNSSGYTSGYNSPDSSTFGPGVNPFLPGMVVTLNTTQDMGPFSGPNTNLAGLFQINVARVVNCDTMIQVWSSWFVGMPIAGSGPVQATVYFVSGDAPDVVDANTPSQAISQPATVNFTVT